MPLLSVPMITFTISLEFSKIFEGEFLLSSDQSTNFFFKIRS